MNCGLATYCVGAKDMRTERDQKKISRSACLTGDHDNWVAFCNWRVAASMSRRGRGVWVVSCDGWDPPTVVVPKYGLPRQTMYTLKGEGGHGHRNASKKAYLGIACERARSRDLG